MVAAAAHHLSARIDEHHAASWFDPCITAIADDVLSHLNLSGIEVRVSELEAGTGGSVRATQPRVIVMSATSASGCAHPDTTVGDIDEQMRPYRDFLASTLAHEAAHVAQNDLVGRPEAPVRQLLFAPVVDRRVERLARALGGTRTNTAGVSVSALERSADCAAEAYGYATFPGLGYDVECTDADLAATVAVIEGRWPTTP
ncbi:hypothetical protein GXB85_13620 [Cellulomonas sp. APG4]|uniref:hypothetical protein n=1 Tax=Cellulomonas sp. APG4 TaxID=1538656 RepID=UPI00137A4C4E|nr:hypothetical protein [Cellulomonas sp. APG4]NCT91981.1 hypothetical protein [Cellulomonas sp. APG4]